MIKFRQETMFRAVALQYLMLCVAMMGIYGFNRGTMRHMLSMTGVVVICAAVAFMFTDRRRDGDGCAVKL